VIIAIHLQSIWQTDSCLSPSLSPALQGVFLVLNKRNSGKAKAESGDPYCRQFTHHRHDILTGPVISISQVVFQPAILLNRVYILKSRLSRGFL